jgi:hypothetical protein
MWPISAWRKKPARRSNDRFQGSLATAFGGNRRRGMPAPTQAAGQPAISTGFARTRPDPGGRNRRHPQLHGSRNRLLARREWLPLRRTSTVWEPFCMKCSRGRPPFQRPDPHGDGSSGADRTPPFHPASSTHGFDRDPRKYLSEVPGNANRKIVIPPQKPSLKIWNAGWPANRSWQRRDPGGIAR